jgi:co-chaperonin GroES (HSP10)
MPASDYQKFSGTLTPLPDHILVCDMETGDRVTEGGIILTDDNGKDRGIRPRWCRVYKVGTNITDVQVGQWVYVEHGRWTWALDFTDETGAMLKVQRVDNQGILGVANERPY